MERQFGWTLTMRKTTIMSLPHRNMLDRMPETGDAVGRSGTRMLRVPSTVRETKPATVLFSSATPNYTPTSRCSFAVASDPDAGSKLRWNKFCKLLTSAPLDCVMRNGSGASWTVIRLRRKGLPKRSLIIH
jgi:hypothetical protein